MDPNDIPAIREANEQHRGLSTRMGAEFVPCTKAAEVTVTQADELAREVLADEIHTNGAHGQAEIIRKGGFGFLGSSEAIRAMVRFARQAEARGIERAAKVADAMERSSVPGPDGKAAAWNIAIGIRALTVEGEKP